MSADFSSRWGRTTISETLRSVWQGGVVGGGSSNSWSQFLQRRRLPPCSWFFPLVAAAAGAMKEDSKEDLKEIILDRGKFKQQLRLRAVRIPKQHSHFVSKTLFRFTLERPKLKHVIHDPESSENRLVLLAEHINESDALEEKLTEIKKTVPVDVIPHDIDLDYRYFSVEQVLKEILPEGWKVPASFETVGHIAHLNLTDELLPYRRIIAEVFLDKNQPKIRTIVNKVGTISNEFRVPTWEVLAGDADLVTEVILDMFAGIGPFAIPAAQQGCVVFANDLNPASVQYLEVNAKINKVTGNINAYNMDAREFMKHLQGRENVRTTAMEKVKDECCDGPFAKESALIQVNSETPTPVRNGADSVEDKLRQGIIAGKSKIAKGPKATSIAKSEAKPWELFHHVVMNLPASALEFLDVFQGLLSKNIWKGPMPRVHCYCFMRASQTASDVVKYAESILGGDIQDPHVWTVRDVAPNKIMLCISFDLPEQVAFREPGLPKASTIVGGNSTESELVYCTDVNADFTDVQSKRLRTES